MGYPWHMVCHRKWKLKHFLNWTRTSISKFVWGAPRCPSASVTMSRWPGDRQDPEPGPAMPAPELCSGVGSGLSGAFCMASREKRASWMRPLNRRELSAVALGEDVSNSEGWHHNVSLAFPYFLFLWSSFLRALHCAGGERLQRWCGSIIDNAMALLRPDPKPVLPASDKTLS